MAGLAQLNAKTSPTVSALHSLIIYLSPASSTHFADNVFIGHVAGNTQEIRLMPQCFRMAVEQVPAWWMTRLEPNLVILTTANSGYIILVIFIPGCLQTLLQIDSLEMILISWTLFQASSSIFCALTSLIPVWNLSGVVAKYSPTSARDTCSKTSNSVWHQVTIVCINWNS